MAVARTSANMPSGPTINATASNATSYNASTGQVMAMGSNGVPYAIGGGGGVPRIDGVNNTVAPVQHVVGAAEAAVTGNTIGATVSGPQPQIAPGDYNMPSGTVTIDANGNVTSGATPARTITTPATPAATAPDVSKINVNTGNPAADAQANALLDQFWQTYKAAIDPNTMQLNPAKLAEITAQSDAAVAPTILAATQRASDIYNTGLTNLQTQSDVQQQQQQANVQYAQQGLGTNLRQIQIDQANQQDVLARNYTQAQLDQSRAYAAAGTTFSGDRQRTQGVVAQNNATDQAYIDQQAQLKQQLQQQAADKATQDAALQERSLTANETANQATLGYNQAATLQGLQDFKAQQATSAANDYQSQLKNYAASLATLPAWATAGGTVPIPTPTYSAGTAPAPVNNPLSTYTPTNASPVLPSVTPIATPLTRQVTTPASDTSASITPLTLAQLQALSTNAANNQKTATQNQQSALASAPTRF